jgi:hypothetical protein
MPSVLPVTRKVLPSSDLQRLGDTSLNCGTTEALHNRWSVQSKAHTALDSSCMNTGQLFPIVLLLLHVACHRIEGFYYHMQASLRGVHSCGYRTCRHAGLVNPSHGPVHAPCK